MVSNQYLAVGAVVAIGAGLLLTQGREDCHREIAEAQVYADQAGACPAVVETLRCPYNNFVRYQATDGCEVGYLKDRGWVSV